MDKELIEKVAAAAPRFLAERTTEETLTAVWAINLIDNLGLMELWNLILAENTSVNLPYHNEQHLLNVVAWCGRLYISDSNGYDRKQLMILITSAMIHDINHSGGELPDALNIQNAFEWFANALDRITDLPLRAWLKHNYEAIVNTVAVTEFPFIHEPKTSLQKILRDADILQNFGVHCVKYLAGLKAEFATAGKPLTNEELISRQAEFMKNVVFFTYTGQSVKQILGPRVFAEQRDAFLNEKKVN